MKTIIKDVVFLTLTTVIVMSLIEGVNAAQNNNFKKVQARAAQTIKLNKKQISYYRQKDQQLSKQYFYDQISKRNYDIVERKKSLNDRLNKAFTITFEQTKNKNDYNQLASKLTPLVGNKFSKELKSKVKPTMQPDGIERTPFAHLDNLKIAYGHLNESTQIIPVVIFASYSSPAIDGTSTGVITKGQDQIKKSSGIYKISYDLIADKIVNFSFKEGAIDHE